MLAVIAESTRIHSNPSRRTSTPVSTIAAAGVRCDAVGSGFPDAVTPCQTRTPISKTPATLNRTRKPVRHGFFPASVVGFIDRIFLFYNCQHILGYANTNFPTRILARANTESQGWKVERTMVQCVQ